MLCPPFARFRPQAGRRSPQGDAEARQDSEALVRARECSRSLPGGEALRVPQLQQRSARRAPAPRRPASDSDCHNRVVDVIHAARGTTFVTSEGGCNARTNACVQALKQYSDEIFTKYGVKDTQDPNAHVQRTPEGACEMGSLLRVCAPSCLSRRERAAHVRQLRSMLETGAWSAWSGRFRHSLRKGSFAVPGSCRLLRPERGVAVRNQPVREGAEVGGARHPGALCLL